MKVNPKPKPAGVFSPKLSRILSQKDTVSPSPAWLKKFEPTVIQNPMAIRRFFIIVIEKYLGKESNSKRCLPIKATIYRTLLGFTLAVSRTNWRNLLLSPTQKIASNTHASGDNGWASIVNYTDGQTVNPLPDLAQNFVRTYIHDDKTVYQILST
ncbi:hypothetical protein AVEN_187901-1 [Araneus ventricosus]|uniref:Uncharacterized protein n=1 Tax=Araneus ventricosus TaxID=182803 RepID=A0A4Y2CU94_ARAVE|nr:hypothetical protein AVEN_187901-1 [Araneus ventricosus]